MYIEKESKFQVGTINYIIKKNVLNLNIKFQNMETFWISGPQTKFHVRS